MAINSLALSSLGGLYIIMPGNHPELIKTRGRKWKMIVQQFHGWRITIAQQITLNIMKTN